MNIWIQALNQPTEAYKKMKSTISWTLVGITILIVVVLDQFLQYFSTDGRIGFNFIKILYLIAAGVATYIMICTIFWIVCKCFGSKTEWITYIKTWGISYFPTMLCALIVAVTEAYYYLFWNSFAWAIIFNIIFGGILIWKTILYFIFLKVVAKLKGVKLFAVFCICGIVIYVTVFSDAMIGLKTPIL